MRIREHRNFFEAHAKYVAALEAGLREIASMKPGPIGDGFVHGPALLLGNCQRIARRVLRRKPAVLRAHKP